MASGTQATGTSGQEPPAIDLSPEFVDYEQKSDADLMRRIKEGRLTRDVFAVPGD